MDPKKFKREENTSRKPDSEVPVYMKERGLCACGYLQALYAGGLYQSCPIDGENCRAPE